MNACPCGYADDLGGRCHCAAEQVARYRHRISGPLIDRIDMHVVLRALPVEDLLGNAPAETENSDTVALRVAAADRKSTRLNSSHTVISYAVFCLKKKTKCDSRLLQSS